MRPAEGLAGGKVLCWKGILLIAITLGGCATAPVARSREAPVDRQARECDSDWDGALLGGAIGISPLLIGSLSHGPGDGVPLGFKLGFIGGIAGFWIGLAIDSRNCGEAT